MREAEGRLEREKRHYGSDMKEIIHRHEAEME